MRLLIIDWHAFAYRAFYGLRGLTAPSGPPPNAIAAMGDKIEAKRLAQAAGVATVPGDAGVAADGDAALAAARDLGYPVILKASAGGGGKGMRIARDAAAVAAGFAAAASEAFQHRDGSGRIVVLRYRKPI